MELKKEIQVLEEELLRVRRLLQEGRPMNDSEYRRLRSQVEAFSLDLERNYRGQDKTS